MEVYNAIFRRAKMKISTGILRQKKLSERTVEYVCGTLRRILKHSLQNRIIAEAPPSAAQIGATAPKDNRRLRVLTQDEMKKLMDEIKQRDVQAWRIVIFAMLAGCRFSDAANLLWGQVDFERKTVSFVKTKTIVRVISVGDEFLSFLKEFDPCRKSAFTSASTTSLTRKRQAL